MEHLVFNTSGAVRHDELDGREYLVAPIAMLAEGVWPGSEGPIFYPSEVIALNTMAWNHKPIVVYHPEMNGKGVSACSPSVLNTRKIGLMLNTKWENGKLKSE